MTATLTDRYLDAALRSVPEKQRADIGAELRASIADQVDARVEAGEPADAAERAVLTELGDPDRLAAGYTGRPLWLVGPRYYLDWLRLLTLLLWIVPLCAAFGVALGQVLSGASVGEVFGSVVSVVIGAIVHVAFWVTLVFVVLERTGHETVDPSPWTPDRLPEPRSSGAGFADLVASLVWFAIVVGAILWDHFLGLAYIDGQWMPVLSAALWPWWIAALFVLVALEALLAIAVYARRGWTYGFATARAALNAAIAVPAVSLLAAGALVNPAVTDALVDAIGADGQNVVAILRTIVGFVVVGIAVWDSIDGFLKARRARAVG